MFLGGSRAGLQWSLLDPSQLWVFYYFIVIPSHLVFCVPAWVSYTMIFEKKCKVYLLSVTSPWTTPFKTYREQPCNGIRQFLNPLQGITLDCRLGRLRKMGDALPGQSMAVTSQPFWHCHLSYVFCPTDQQEQRFLSLLAVSFQECLHFNGAPFQPSKAGLTCVGSK